jgi:hypothetical protein
MRACTLMHTKCSPHGCIQTLGTFLQSEASISECAQEISAYLTRARSIQSSNRNGAQPASSAPATNGDASSRHATKQESDAIEEPSEQDASTAEKGSKKRGRSKKNDKDGAGSNCGSNGGLEEGSEASLASRVTFLGETQFLFSHIKQTMKVFILT